MSLHQKSSSPEADKWRIAQRYCNESYTTCSVAQTPFVSPKHDTMMNDESVADGKDTFWSDIDPDVLMERSVADSWSNRSKEGDKKRSSNNASLSRKPCRSRNISEPPNASKATLRIDRSAQTDDNHQSEQNSSIVNQEAAESKHHYRQSRSDKSKKRKSHQGRQTESSSKTSHKISKPETNNEAFIMQRQYQMQYDQGSRQDDFLHSHHNFTRRIIDREEHLHSDIIDNVIENELHHDVSLPIEDKQELNCITSIHSNPSAFNKGLNTGGIERNRVSPEMASLEGHLGKKQFESDMKPNGDKARFDRNTDFDDDKDSFDLELPSSNEISLESPHNYLTSDVLDNSVPADNSTYLDGKMDQYSRDNSTQQKVVEMMPRNGSVMAERFVNEYAEYMTNNSKVMKDEMIFENSTHTTFNNDLRLGDNIDGPTDANIIHAPCHASFVQSDNSVQSASDDKAIHLPSREELIKSGKQNRNCIRTTQRPKFYASKLNGSESQYNEPSPSYKITSESSDNIVSIKSSTYSTFIPFEETDSNFISSACTNTDTLKSCKKMKKHKIPKRGAMFCRYCCRMLAKYPKKILTKRRKILNPQPLSQSEMLINSVQLPKSYGGITYERKGNGKYICKGSKQKVIIKFYYLLFTVLGLKFI